MLLSSSQHDMSSKATVFPFTSHNYLAQIGASLPTLSENGPLWNTEMRPLRFLPPSTNQMLQSQPDGVLGALNS